MNIAIQKLKALAADAIGKEPGSPAQFLAWQNMAKLANPAAVLDLIAEIERQSAQFKEWQASHHANYCAVADERDQLKAENERLQRFETAYKEFSDKTDWVRPNAATQELGMHVADILRKRCDDLTSHNQAQADEIKALRSALVDVSNEIDCNTRPLIRDLVNGAAGLNNGSHPNDLYADCDRVDAIIDTALGREQQP